MLRGVARLDFKFTLTMAAYNLVKLPRLIASGGLNHYKPAEKAQQRPGS